MKTSYAIANIYDKLSMEIFMISDLCSISMIMINETKLVASASPPFLVREKVNKSNYLKILGKN